MASTPRYSASLSKRPWPSFASETVRMMSVPASSSCLKAYLAAVDASLSEANKKRADFLFWKIFSMAELSKGTTSAFAIKKTQISAKITFYIFIFLLYFTTCNMCSFIVNILNLMGVINKLLYILFYFFFCFLAILIYTLI